MHRRTTTAIAALAACSLLLGACGSSGGDAAPSTTRAVTTTTAPTTTPTTATTADGATQRLPSCQDLLQEFTDVFLPDDLQPVIDWFRRWAPEMPAEVGAAVNRLADAYEEADGTLGNVDLADVDLTAAAQTFSDWTAAGCPPG